MVILAYPAMDLLLVAPLARSTITPVWRNWSYRLLVAAIALMLVADEIYGVDSSGYLSRRLARRALAALLRRVRLRRARAIDGWS